MNLQHRIEILEKLGNYILSDDAGWQQAKDRAALENTWFTPESIQLASNTAARYYLNGKSLYDFAHTYKVKDILDAPCTVGIVMAGNIPLVGFHDFLCAFLSGHKQLIKPSSKDQVLIKHLVKKLMEWEPAVANLVGFAEMLKGCDAYIATGSNNTARYFEQYFGKYPNIIRKNRTSVAILTGNETKEELEALADDVHQYFGLGCRNVTKIYVPQDYDFVPILEAFRKYSAIADHHKFKNNYDYQLAVLIINKLYYMTNGSILLVESPQLFAPISQLHYEFYSDISNVLDTLKGNEELQCIVGYQGLPFGSAQKPSLADFADGTDTMKFLLSL